MNTRRARVKFAPLITRQAFTLVELLVVIAIIGLLSTVAVGSLNSAAMNARNAKRKADLLQLSKALELYYADHNGYPVSGGWRGVCGYGDWDNDDSGSKGAWIPGLTSGGYLARLPRDPRTCVNNLNSPDSFCFTYGSASGYLYNSNGTDFAILAYCTPEGPNSMQASDPFVIPGRARAWRVVSQKNATTDGWY